MDKTDVLARPIITEKSIDEAGKGRFTFAVAKSATKAEIRNAVENHFKVNVLAVHTLITKGRNRKTGRRRTVIHTAPIKKAIVTLQSGQRIELFDVQTEAPKEDK